MWEEEEEESRGKRVVESSVFELHTSEFSIMELLLWLWLWWLETGVPIETASMFMMLWIDC